MAIDKDKLQKAVTECEKVFRELEEATEKLEVVANELEEIKANAEGDEVEVMEDLNNSFPDEEEWRLAKEKLGVN